MEIGTIDAAEMAAKNTGSLFTKKDRKRNIVRLDSFRYTPLDRTSKAAVMISSMRTSLWPCSSQSMFNVCFISPELTWYLFVR